MPVARSATARLRPPSQHDPVAKTPAAGPMGLDGEALRAKASLEMLLPGFCPHAEDTTRVERLPAALDRLASIEGISIDVGVGMGTLEEIQHDRVVGNDAVCGLADAIGDIANPERYPRIVETCAAKRRERATTPLRNDRTELCHLDLTLIGKRVEYRPQCDPHPEPAHENASSGSKVRARSHPEFFLRAARATVHEHTAAHTDQEVVHVSLSQLEDTGWAIPAIQRVPGPTHDRTGRVPGPTAGPIAVLETAADAFADNCNLNDRVPPFI